MPEADIATTTARPRHRFEAIPPVLEVELGRPMAIGGKIDMFGETKTPPIGRRRPTDDREHRPIAVGIEMGEPSPSDVDDDATPSNWRNDAYP
jgi:hypothetical protein